jgi:DNA-binding MarR family transcriptional regulator
MSENDYTGMKAVRVGDILADLRLAEEDFEQADTYLLQSGYLEGTIGGVAGSRWMQPAGLDFLEQEMEKRIPLSLTAEQILRLAIELEDKDPQTTVGGREMWEQLNITYDEYKKATLILGDEGLIESRISAEDTKFMTFAVTSSGRKALRRNFRKESTDIAARHLNIGAIFQGDVTDVNVLAVAQAYHSSIEQAITQSDTSSLRDEIEKILGELGWFNYNHK